MLSASFLLQAKHGHRVAVIENEVGQIGIDNQLLQSLKRTSENAARCHSRPVSMVFHTFFYDFPLYSIRNQDKIHINQRKIHIKPDLTPFEVLPQSHWPLAIEVVLLDNGCLCCTVRADLVEAVKQILLKVRGRPFMSKHDLRCQEIDEKRLKIAEKSMEIA